MDTCTAAAISSGSRPCASRLPGIPGYSREHFIRAFRTTYGETPHKFMEQKA
ncbi:MAG TPA: helix-turn-helix transcriptional regulator [Trebonia sp.]|nr:helix-turn-helix transcriptional regulator [Trebonia sp.]